MNAKRLYLRKLEGEKLASLVQRYTAIKKDEAESYKLLSLKEKIRKETYVLKNMHPRELSPRSSILNKLSG